MHFLAASEWARRAEHFGVKCQGLFHIASFEYRVANTFHPRFDAAQTKFQMVAIGIVEIDRAVKRRLGCMFDRDLERVLGQA